ncbi:MULTISPECIES: NAD(P)/FAD-dependent oxidoreductase [Rhizobium/Agrobacterium group]|uniref:NAD(P)/FAD-dependent oxidoreductase n=1 Tax=Rhizobium/Agrobacterium group TaxID=227290 RepID=UPI001ADC9C4D|nr:MULTISPECIES: NAD(P)/FAD-dependent oxidoreductase [Rhizobium/Agrobacterium group]MBO9112541.1 FAD-dependent oxidoreductase [Agrobacterium sp. S2/73]QXZ76051.1 FAD-dependent oxidoreductase [Agrobacterium sp. S7/73]QYA16939.1 FAD-dependent oxidoreductase [Rhizobium sp. AB2/73]UEQ85488.1 FAD-dependent oxidoreductase [Rhizobium sp. AB2/73]
MLNSPIPTTSLPSIDLLYDYGSFLRLSDCEGGIGSVAQNSLRPRIGIVGAGISGLVAATELLRAGITDLVLFEARDRMGGRAWSQIFDPREPNLIAEMGAMRFPSSATCLFHYLDKFRIDTAASFPDPGIVDTEVHYRGERYLWQAGESPPPLFKRVYQGWQALINDGYVHEGIQLPAPAKITTLLRSRRFDEARQAWQAWLDSFRDLSFYSALVTIFTGPRPPGRVPWKRPEDFELFGSLGIGSGGFLPVYQAAFTEILRLVINGYEDDQRLIMGGISLLVKRLAEQEFHGVSLQQRVRNGHVSRIYKQDGQILLMGATGQVEPFDRVIVTTSNRAMELAHCLTADGTFLNNEVLRAVRQTHLTGSSKLFMLTESKFWLKGVLPTTILSDGLARGVYCLDYQPDDPDGKGVVLLSYTWEDDANKMLSILDKKERCRRLVDDLATISADFARHLVPANGDYERHVLQHDWLMDPYSIGAFKLNYPGEDIYSQQLFFQFTTAKRPEEDTGLYLAGCGCSFTGGWVEGALQTGLNAACAVIRSCGGQLLEGNPIDEMTSAYRY